MTEWMASLIRIDTNLHWSQKYGFNRNAIFGHMINRDENKYMAEHSFISIIIHVEEDLFPMAVSKGDCFYLSFAQHYTFQKTEN